MTKQFTMLVDHDRRPHGDGSRIPSLEFLIRACHTRPLSRRLDRDIDGAALNYNNTTRKDLHAHDTL